MSNQTDMYLYRITNVLYIYIYTYNYVCIYIYIYIYIYHYDIQLIQNKFDGVICFASCSEDRLGLQQDLLSASSVGRILALCSSEAAFGGGKDGCFQWLFQVIIYGKPWLYIEH